MPLWRAKTDTHEPLSDPTCPVTTCWVACCSGCDVVAREGLHVSRMFGQYELNVLNPRSCALADCIVRFSESCRSVHRLSVVAASDLNLRALHSGKISLTLMTAMT